MKTMLVKSAVVVLVGGALSFAAVAKPMKLVTVTVSNYAGTTELTNFPVLVRISTEKINGFSYDDCATDGADVSFVDADGAALAHEIDTWNEEGESTIWVKVPVLTNGVAFVMRWRDDNPPSVTASDAWNSDYVGVWHMGEESGVCANSTSLGEKYNATPVKNTDNSVRYSGTDAPVGGARTTAAFTTTSDKEKNRGYLSVPSYTEENVGDCFVMSGWMRIPGEKLPGTWYPRMVERKNNGYDTNGGFAFAIDDLSGSDYYGRIVWVRGGDNTIIWCKNFPSAMETWVHWAIVFEGKSCRLYGNGNLMTTTAGSVNGAASYTVGAAVDNGLSLSFGCDSDGNDGYFYGAFDEYRLKKGAANADWVKAEYDTVTDGSFVTFGEVITRRGMLLIIR